MVGEDDLGARVREELKNLVRLGLGCAPIDRVQKDAPLLWDRSARLYPTFSSLSDVPLRSLLREAVRIAEPAERAESAGILLGLVNSTYGKTLDFRRDEAGRVYAVAASTFRQEKRYETAVLDEVAARAVQILSLPSISEPRDRRHKAVPRQALESSLSAILDTESIVNVCGEPGAGKSWLTQRVLDNRGLSYVVLRASSIELLAADIASVGRRIGVNTVGSWRLDLRGFLAALSSSSPYVAYVWDGVDDSDIAEEIVLGCSILGVGRCIVTSRRPISVDNVPEFWVPDFALPEAIACCRQAGLRDGEEDLTQLCRAVGLRPLAIQQAALFLGSSGRTSVRGLTQYLRASVDQGLDTIAKATRSQFNLSVLYRAMLRELEGNSSVCSVLDCLTLLGPSGYPSFESSFDIAALMLDTSTPEVAFDAAIFHLYNAGLLSSMPGKSVFEAPQFSALTLEFIRDLRAGQQKELCGRIADLLFADLALEAVGQLPERVRLLRKEVAMVRKHPEWMQFAEWGEAVCLDAFAWLYIPAPTLDIEGPTIVNVGTASVTRLAGGAWTPLDHEEVRMMLTYAEWWKSVVDAWLDDNEGKQVDEMSI